MKVVTLVVERVVSEVEGVNHGGGVLRQRRRHLLGKVPGDGAEKLNSAFLWETFRLRFGSDGRGSERPEVNRAEAIRNGPQMVMSPNQA